MAPIPDHILIKLNEADEIPRKVLDLCCKQLVEPNKKTLTEISVRIGTIANILRSTLNNMMWDFSKQYIAGNIPDAEFEKLRWSHDYPIEETEEKFLNSRIRALRHIEDNYPQIFNFVESTQPYYDFYAIMWTIKLLSNDTTHSIPIQIQQPNISSIATEFGNPQIFGDKVLLPRADNPPLILQTPCFIEPLDMFVSKEGKWILYMIGIDQNPKQSVTSFIGRAHPVIKGIINNFYNLLDAL